VPARRVTPPVAAQEPSAPAPVVNVPRARPLAFTTTKKALRTPPLCACCLERPHATFTLRAKRESAVASAAHLFHGVGILADLAAERASWRIPVCLACRRHARWHAFAVYAGIAAAVVAIIGTFVFALGGDALILSAAWVVVLLGLVAGAVTYVLIRWRFVERTPGCAAVGTPVSVTWRSQITFTCSNAAWGRRFGELNS